MALGYKANVGEIEVCMITYNEEQLIERSLRAVSDYFDAFTILDMESTDRTREIAHDILGSKLNLVTRARSYLLELGFADARNCVSSWARRDWVLHIDSDEVMKALDLNGGECLASGAKPAFKIKRNNLLPRENFNPLTDDTSVLDIQSVEHHVRLFKRIPESRWESFLHEELWIANNRAHDSADHSEIVIDHLAAFKPYDFNERKENFYAWMMCKVKDNVDLQYRMREFYFTEYFESRRDDLRTRADLFTAEDAL